MRLEKGFCLYGNDIDENTCPIEAGLGWITKFTKNFINYKTLKSRKEGSLSKKLVGLELIDKGIARKNYLIFSNETEIGIITSGTMFPKLNKANEMGYIKKELAAINTEVLIQVRNNKLKTKVVSIPFI